MGLILSRDEFPFSGSSHKFEGHLFGDDVPVSIFFVDAQPGRGAKLHRHPYAEVFLTLEGKATFTVGDDQFEVVAGQVVIALPNEPHAFVNSGDGPLRQIDIHCNGRIIQHDLDESTPTAAPS
jgi:quercetin dioxygenase-like cupin family protein